MFSACFPCVLDLKEIRTELLTAPFILKLKKDANL